MARQEVDLELKMAFAAQQQKLIETRQKLRFSDIQIDTLNKVRLQTSLTDKEMANLPGDTKVFESIGRMFVLQDIPTVRNILARKDSNCKEKINTLEHNKTYLERNLKESENNLREMVQHRKDMVAAVE